MGTYGSIVSFFQEGGPFMIPIAIVMALGIAVAIERWIYLSAAGAKNRSVWNRVSTQLKSGNLAAVDDVLSSSNAAVASVLSYGLARARARGTRDDVEKAMEEGLMEAMPKLEKRTGYLATFANLATLLGLLGTIMGLITAFTAVANANPAEKADLLSASISVAMNTTAFGLMVAIPLLLIHALLQSRTNEIIDSLEMASVKFLNAVSERSAAAPAAATTARPVTA